jgi:hypothetical protein
MLSTETGKEVRLLARFGQAIPVVQLLEQGIDAVPDAPPPRPIADATSLILTGDGYASEAEAMTAGELWRNRLMRAFACLNVGADFGDETRLGGGWTPEALAAFRRGGRVVLNDPHKLWVYESTTEKPLFLAMDPIPPEAYWVSSPHERLEAALIDAIAAGGLSREAEVSYGLYVGSFGLTPEPRFAMLMMALESLIKLRPRSAAVQAHVISMIEATKEKGLPPNEVK